MRFLAEHPEYDGRGVTVAIFDTGVDPGAAGLARTTDGKVKVVDIVDATGSGDVVMGDPVEVEDGRVKGLTGRALCFGKNWKIDDGRVRLGMKAAWELYPEALVARLREKRREGWDAAQRTLERALRAEVDAFRKAHEKPDAARKEELAELEARLSACEKMGKGYEDPGPVFDCVLFREGGKWRAVVDTDEDGDLEDEKVLAEYDVAQQFGTFGEESLMNFGVHVYEDGKILSLVTDSGTHGTHVAGIVAAHFPDDPALNGIAPGARIVSVKIGDNRLDGMETGHALRRAIAVARAHKVDLVNMSFGEPTRTPNQSALMDELRELIHEDGVVFVSSAGNEGPALSTVGAPGGTMSVCIGVGAYVSPALMRAGYSLLRDLPGTHYTWTSRGPTKDGDLGVDISAPGGAISPVPRWALTRGQLMNGTSMASPNACGGLALVLSGLKAERVGYTPEWVKRAITTTGVRVEGVDVFGQGHGMLQVDRTFELLRSLSEAERAWPRLEVSVGEDRGVYLRDGSAAGRKQTFKVSVTPEFTKETPRAVLADFQARVVLRATEGWIRAPRFYLASSEASAFEIELDPMGLEPGVHFGEVLGFAVGHEERGPLFRVPVTVVKPMEAEWDAQSGWSEEFEFDTGGMRRLFFNLPDGATWAELEVRGIDLDGPRRLLAHVQHADPQEAHRNMGVQFRWDFDGETKSQQQGSFVARGGGLLEICLAQNWSSFGTGRYEVKLRLHGTAAYAGDAVFTRGEKIQAVTVVSHLLPEKMAPTARMSAFRRIVAPSKHTLRALTGDARDAMRGGRAPEELVLEYSFKIGKQVTVTPRITALNDRLYETEFESQLQMLYDGNKRLVGTDDAYPDGFELEEGDYVLRLQLRHRDRSTLEKLKDLAVALEFSLKEPLELPVSANADRAISEGSREGGGILRDGRRVPLFLGEPDWKKLPDTCRDGDVLLGALVLQQGAPEALPLACEVRLTADAAEKKPEPEKDIMLDLRRKALGILLAKKKLEEFDAVAANTLESYPDDVPTLLLMLRRQTAKGWQERAADVMAAADAVIGKIDDVKLAVYLGQRHEDGESKSERAVIHERRESLITALSWKVRAQIASKVSYATTLENLGKWADPENEAYSSMNRERYTAEKRWGKLLALLNEGDLAEEANARRRMEVLRKLGWVHWIAAEERRLMRDFPGEYAPF